jgi:hypothetical protein
MQKHWSENSPSEAMDYGAYTDLNEDSEGPFIALSVLGIARTIKYFIPSTD